MNNGADKLAEKIKTASRWSQTTEMIAKIFVPITNMILARIITPKEFGVIASITMVISFIDIFTEAGFQKYIIQKNDMAGKEIEYYNTAFSANVLLSIACYVLIVVFRWPIAVFLGSSRLQGPLCIAALSLPLTSFISIQSGIFKRNLHYEVISLARILSVVLPFFITIPLALWGYGVWAIIIGSLGANGCILLVLLMRSTWRPRLRRNPMILREMLTFSSWSMGEALMVWGGTYVGIFILTMTKNDYYTGLYKVSLTTTEGILATIYAPILSVMYASLPKYKNNINELFSQYTYFLKKMAFFLLPLGAGIFLYKDIVTLVLLGKKWHEAENFIGIWGISVALTILLGQSGFEFYRALGNAKIPFFMQSLYLLLLAIALTSAIQVNYATFTFINALVKVVMILFNLSCLSKVFHLPIAAIGSAILPYLGATCIMYLFGLFMRKVNNGLMWQLLSIGLCIIVYFLVVLLIKKGKRKWGVNESGKTNSR